MSLESRIADLAAAIGADIKAMQSASGGVAGTMSTGFSAPYPKYHVAMAHPETSVTPASIVLATLSVPEGPEASTDFLQGWSVVPEAGNGLITFHVFAPFYLDMPIQINYLIR
jgi:hypothetical protein